jgi:hypothetical protein
MSRSEHDRRTEEAKARLTAEAAARGHELSDAELAAVSAAGEPSKGPGPEGPQKKPEPKGT